MFRFFVSPYMSLGRGWRWNMDGFGMTLTKISTFSITMLLSVDYNMNVEQLDGKMTMPNLLLRFYETQIFPYHYRMVECGKWLSKFAWSPLSHLTHTQTHTSNVLRVQRRDAFSTSIYFFISDFSKSYPRKRIRLVVRWFCIYYSL